LRDLRRFPVEAAWVFTLSSHFGLPEHRAELASRHCAAHDCIFKLFGAAEFFFISVAAHGEESALLY